MTADIRWLGHSCFEITAGGATVLVDPFLTGNPKAAASADDMSPDVILLTHGHGDHLGDTVDIAKRSGATVVAIVELDEGPQLLTNVVDCDVDEVVVGMEVEVCFKSRQGLRLPMVRPIP